MLESYDDRRAAQSLLDYWADFLFHRDPNIEPPDSTLARADPSRRPYLPDLPRPYVGLEAFSDKSARFFFGRDGLLASAINKLTQPQGRLLVVFGASGSGKSSLVLAGLIPRLKEGAVAGSESGTTSSAAWCLALTRSQTWPGRLPGSRARLGKR